MRHFYKSEIGRSGSCSYHGVSRVPRKHFLTRHIVPFSPGFFLNLCLSTVAIISFFGYWNCRVSPNFVKKFFFWRLSFLQSSIDNYQQPPYNILTGLTSFYHSNNIRQTAAGFTRAESGRLYSESVLLLRPMTYYQVSQNHLFTMRAPEPWQIITSDTPVSTPLTFTLISDAQLKNVITSLLQINLKNPTNHRSLTTKWGVSLPSQLHSPNRLSGFKRQGRRKRLKG